MTKDNISVTVDAVVFMKIVNTKDSVVNIRNVWDSVMKIAQTTIRDVVGDVELDELLARRDEVATKIANIIDRETADWGGRHHFSEPPNCGIARRHETRNRKTSRSRTRKTCSNNQKPRRTNSSRKPGTSVSKMSNRAMYLRTLSSLEDISFDQSNTIVFAVPMDIVNGEIIGMSAFTEATKSKKNSQK